MKAIESGLSGCSVGTGAYPVSSEARWQTAMLSASNTRGVLLTADGRNIEQIELEARLQTMRQLELLERGDIPRSVSDAVAYSVAHPTFHGHKLEETPERLALAREIEAVNDRHWLVESPAEIELAARVAGQLQLAFSEKEQRMNARIEIAQYLERVVCPESADEKVWDLPMRLRRARLNGAHLMREDGKTMIRWQEKAGLPLIDPDDARQEATRLKRRVIPKLLELVAKGCCVHYMVGTMDNAPTGKLRRTMFRCQRRVRAIMKMKRDGKPRFPALKGYVATLEAPLGSNDTWNVHVNVLWVTDGSYLDYADLRQAWGSWMYIERVGARRRKDKNGKPVPIETAIEDSLRELIKYPVRTVAEKSSEAKGKGGRPPAPPMVEWSADQWLEWWYAHKGFRRTRTGGCLFKLPKPEKESCEGYTALGTVHWQGGRYVHSSALLSSILGDKSTKNLTEESVLTAYRALCRRVLEPPDGSDFVREAWARSSSWQNVCVE